MVMAEKKRREKAGEEIRKGPSVATWSPEVNLLAVIIDRLSALIEIQKAKPQQPVAYDRPRTAFDRLERTEMRDIHDMLVAALIPSPTD